MRVSYPFAWSPIGFDANLEPQYQRRIEVHRVSSVTPANDATLHPKTVLVGNYAAGQSVGDAAAGHSLLVTTTSTASSTVRVTIG